MKTSEGILSRFLFKENDTKFTLLGTFIAGLMVIIGVSNFYHGVNIDQEPSMLITLILISGWLYVAVSLISFIVGFYAYNNFGVESLRPPVIAFDLSVAFMLTSMGLYVLGIMWAVVSFLNLFNNLENTEETSNG